MSLTSTESRYGSIAITIHWATAAAILGLLTSGLIMANQPPGSDVTSILRGHAVMGTAVLVLTVLRIFWWWLADRRPGDVQGMPGWQARASHIVHTVLYLVILVMAVSGIGTLLLSNALPALFGGAAGGLPDFSEVPPRLVHGLASRVLIALLLMHIGAALYHQFIRHDHLLARMGLGRAVPPAEPRLGA